MSLFGSRTPRKRLASAVVAAAAATAAVVVVAAGPATATTGNSLFPQPKAQVPVKVFSPVLGRFFVTAAGRPVHLVGGMLDTDLEEEGLPPFMIGELEMRLATKSGRIETALLDLYPFEYKDGKLSAGLIAPVTVNEEHPLGVKTGELTVTVPRSAQGTANKSKELKKMHGKLKLNGHGPYPIRFTRGNSGTPPPNPLPRVKQVGK